jgi:tetratricopeptide (TPR) repeat protein
MKYIFSLLFVFFNAEFVFSQHVETVEIDSMLSVVENLKKADYPYGVALGLKAFDDSRKIDYKEGMVFSSLLLSRNQYELGKFDDALKNASTAAKLAQSVFDLKSYSDARRIKGLVLTRLKQYKAARIEFNQALNSAKKLESEQTRSSRVGVIFNDIAFLIDETGENLDSVSYYYGKGYREFEKMALSNSLKNKTLSLACANVGSSFLRVKELDSAQYYLDKALQLANAVDHKVVIATTLNDLGSLNYLKKDYNLSIDYFQKAILITKEIDNPFILKSSYLGISKAFKKINDNISSEEFLSKYITLSDSLEKTGSLFKNDRNLLEKQKTIAHPSRSDRSVIFIAFLSLIFVVGIYFGLGEKKKKKIADISTVNEVESLSTSIVVDEEILKRLVILAKQDDPSFLGLFKDVYPEFYKKLEDINPNLIAGEQKMAALLKLDFTTKEIASYTNSSVRAVEAKKYRLRKKLNISSEADINVWMMNT